MAADVRQNPRSFSQVFSVAGPLVVAGLMMLALDIAFYIASGGLFLFSIVFLYLWLVAVLGAVALLHALLAVVPPALISLLVVGASFLRRLVSRNLRGHGRSFPGFLAS